LSAFLSEYSTLYSSSTTDKRFEVLCSVEQITRQFKRSYRWKTWLSHKLLQQSKIASITGKNKLNIVICYILSIQYLIWLKRQCIKCLIHVG